MILYNVQRIQKKTSFSYLNMVCNDVKYCRVYLKIMS